MDRLTQANDAWCVIRVRGVRVVSDAGTTNLHSTSDYNWSSFTVRIWDAIVDPDLGAAPGSFESFLSSLRSTRAFSLAPRFQN